MNFLGFSASLQDVVVETSPRATCRRTAVRPGAVLWPVSLHTLLCCTRVALGPVSVCGESSSRDAGGRSRRSRSPEPSLREITGDSSCSSMSSADGRLTLLFGLIYFSTGTPPAAGSPDYSGYLSRVLRNYTARACDGSVLSVSCPPRSSITVQSAFYGVRGSDTHRCPPSPQAVLGYYNQDQEERLCTMSTALQKMLDECQDRRSCQVLIHSRVFGPDPCPGSRKYLLLWYKCRPNEYKSKVVCEEEKLRLSCKRGMQIHVYSAMFGRTQQGALECPDHHRRGPSVECHSAVALQGVSSLCQGRQRCVLVASTQEFGEPCYPGTRKYLSVIYTCVPKKLLQEEPRPPVYAPPPSAHDPNIVGDSAPPEGSSVRTDRGSSSEKPTERERGGSRPDMNPIINSTSSPEMALLTNALTAYNYVADHPERTALFFVIGVCLGLFLTLFALVLQISCRTDCEPRRRPRLEAQKLPRSPLDSSSTDSADSDSDWDASSDLSARRHRRFERTLNMNVFTSAEELERAQRLEERERIIREIWMNGQPDVPGTRSLNRYY